MKLLVISLMGLFSNFQAWATPMDDADALYDKRGEGPTLIDQATTLYEKILASKPSSLDDTIYVVEQIGRLQSYGGQLIPKKTIAKRMPYFQRCMKAADYISPEKTGHELVEYYYYKGSCLAQYSEAKGITASLSSTGEIIRLLEAGRAIDPTYNGGGFDRILGGLFNKLPSVNPFGPSGSPKLAIKYLEASVKSPAHASEIEPGLSTGRHYYETYHLWAEALLRLNDKKGAKTLIENVVKRINKGDYSSFRKPETMLAKQRLLEIKPK